MITINVNGFRSRQAELRRFIEKQGDNCIFALTDTRLKKDVEVSSFNGYSMIRKDRNASSCMATAGGVALIVPKRWACVQIPLTASGDNFEAIAAVLLPPERNSRPFKILCIYPINYICEMAIDFLLSHN